MSRDLARFDRGALRFAAIVDGAEERLAPKTANALARFAPDALIALLDNERAGAPARSILAVDHQAPVVASIAEADSSGANALLIGVAPVGGRLGDSWRRWVLDALDRGWPVWSGLHTQLSDDAEFTERAARCGGRLVDLRYVPENLEVSRGRSRHVDAHVVQTVGTDCNVGKMTAAWEITQELRRRGHRAAFVATGQTGILLAGRGVGVDRVPADFVAGVVEQLVCEAARDHDWVVVEGQGALHHPGFSAVTLGILHGAAPRSLILCHELGRNAIRGFEQPVPTLAHAVGMYERAADWIRPARVVGVALNSLNVAESELGVTQGEWMGETEWTASDVVRDGAGALVDALLAVERQREELSR